MAEQKASASDAAVAMAKRIVAGEEIATVLGIPESKIQALAALGYNSYQQGQLKDAETLFRGVAALDRKSYYGYAGLGALALAQRPPDLETAYKNLSKAVELNPNDATVRANLGEVLLRQGKVEEARTHLERAFQLDPGHNDPGANRARAMVGGLNIVVKEVQQRLQAQAQTKRAKAS